VASYRRLHEWIAATFALLGLNAELSPDRRKDVLGQCFVGAERFDLLFHGRKVAGAAQRRAKQGLLIQGSIQTAPEELGRAELATALHRAAERRGDLAWLAWELPETLHRAALSLAETKYSRHEYNDRC
jgi:lipoate-protein ligase A